MVRKINFDKVYNQETKFGETLAKRMADPQMVLSIYSRQTLQFSEKSSSYIDLTKKFICYLVIIFLIIRLLFEIPGDIKIENNKIKFFDTQRRNDCYSEYIENSCNTTTSPELLKQCKKLYECYTSIDRAPKKVNILSFEWDIFNSFFFFLTKKSAAILGFILGCFIYYNLSR